MARAHIRAPFRGGGKSARLTQWIGPADQPFVAVASGGKTIIESVSFEEPLTIMRTRGMVSIQLQTFAGDLSIVGAFGIGIVSAEAFAAGVGSVPGPFTNADWGGWFVWRSFGHHFELQTAVAGFLGSWSMEIDSKAMRKVSPNEVMVVVAESEVGAFLLFDGTRHLTKLA